MTFFTRVSSLQKEGLQADEAPLRYQRPSGRMLCSPTPQFTQKEHIGARKAPNNRKSVTEFGHTKEWYFPPSSPVSLVMKAIIWYAKARLCRNGDPNTGRSTILLVLSLKNKVKATNTKEKNRVEKIYSRFGRRRLLSQLIGGNTNIYPCPWRRLLQDSVKIAVREEKKIYPHPCLCTSECSRISSPQ